MVVHPYPFALNDHLIPYAQSTLEYYPLANYFFVRDGDTL